MQIIDLTDSEVPNDSQIKRRTLPPSLIGSSLNSQKVDSKSDVRKTSSSHSSKTVYEANSNNRNISYAIQPSASHSSKTVYEANINNRNISYVIQPSQSSVGKLKVSFSLINSTEFTATSHSGNVDRKVIHVLKLIPGAKFDWDSQRFIFPISSHDILEMELRRCHCEVNSIPRQILTAAQLSVNAKRIGQTGVSSKVDLNDYLSDRIISALAPFQMDAVKFIIEKDGRALVADEMGLGKTRTAIAAACAYHKDWPVLVICPSSAKYCWKAELCRILCPHRITDSQILMVDASNVDEETLLKSFCPFKFVVVSYTIFTKLDLSVQNSPFNVVIVDESHYLKSRLAQRTKAIVPFVQNSRRAILLSGTPALSRPLELFTQLNALVPDKFPDFKLFAERYCQNAKRTGNKPTNSLFGNQYEKHSHWGDNRYKGANFTQELHVVLTNSVMIRRLKKDILQTLPKKNRSLIKISIENVDKREEFRKLLLEMKHYDELRKKKNLKQAKDDNPAEGNVRVERKNILMKLYLQSGREKLSSMIKYIQTYIVKFAENKILLFAHHKEVLDGVCNFLNENKLSFIRIDGRTPAETRHLLCEEFQNDVTIRIGVLGITAAGIALTLTAANVVFFLEFYWTPAALIQAEDRVHRIGQLRNVDVFYFFAIDSVDELLWPLVRKKMQLIGEFVEGQTDQDLVAQICENSQSEKTSKLKIIDLEKDDMNNELIEIVEEIAASEFENTEEDYDGRNMNDDVDEYDSYLKRQDCVDKLALKFIEISQSLVFQEDCNASVSERPVVVDLCENEKNGTDCVINKKRRILPTHMVSNTSAVAQKSQNIVHIENSTGNFLQNPFN